MQPLQDTGTKWYKTQDQTLTKLANVLRPRAPWWCGKPSPNPGRSHPLPEKASPDDWLWTKATGFVVIVHEGNYHFTSLAVQQQFRHCCLLRCEDQIVSICHLIWIWLLTLPGMKQLKPRLCAARWGERANRNMCVFSWGIFKGLPEATPNFGHTSHMRTGYTSSCWLLCNILSKFHIDFVKCRVIRCSLVFPPNPDKQTLGLHFFTLPLAGHSKLCLWWNQWGNAPLWLLVIWISHLNHGERVTLLLPYLGSKKDCNTAPTTWRILLMYDNYWSPKKTKSYILDQRFQETQARTQLVTLLDMWSPRNERQLRDGRLLQKLPMACPQILSLGEA